MGVRASKAGRGVSKSFVDEGVVEVGPVKPACHTPGSVDNVFVIVSGVLPSWLHLSLHVHRVLI